MIAERRVAKGRRRLAQFSAVDNLARRILRQRDTVVLVPASADMAIVQSVISPQLRHHRVCDGRRRRARLRQLPAVLCQASFEVRGFTITGEPDPTKSFPLGARNIVPVQELDRFAYDFIAGRVAFGLVELVIQWPARCLDLDLAVRAAGAIEVQGGDDLVVVARDSMAIQKLQGAIAIASGAAHNVRPELFSCH